MITFTLPKDATTKPFSDHWKFCVGSGHAALAMRTDYVEQLKFIHDELGIERVRFHGIFDDDMHTLHTLRDLMPIPGGGRFKEQSFRLPGLVYDNVLKAGMRPFVELGFMPKHLAKLPLKGFFFYKPIVALPKSDKAWWDYIQAFARYLLRRYGKEEVEQWCFEVWNEPDLPGVFFDGRQKDYFHLYEVTYRAIKDVDPDLMVGGPATSASKWVPEFLEYTKAHDCMPDFVSTHQYAGDPLGGVSSDNTDAPKKQEKHGGSFKTKGTVLEGFRNLMKDEAKKDLPDYAFRTNAKKTRETVGDLPLYYTEWNCCAVFSAYSNDTKRVPAYDVKATLDVEPYVTGSSVWCFSDIFEELHPFPEEFHGGFGLLTQHGIPKPSFYGLKFLSQLGSERWVLDDETYMRGAVAMGVFQKEQELELLLTRSDLSTKELPEETVCIELPLGGEPVSVTEQRIDDTHCNPLKVWEDMGSTLDLTPSEVEEIKQKSHLKEEPIPFAVEDGKLKLTTKLAQNDVSLIKVKLG